MYTDVQGFNVRSYPFRSCGGRQMYGKFSLWWHCLWSYRISVLRSSIFFLIPLNSHVACHLRDRNTSLITTRKKRRECSERVYFTLFSPFLKWSPYLDTCSMRYCVQFFISMSDFKVAVCLLDWHCVIVSCSF